MPFNANQRRLSPFLDHYFTVEINQHSYIQRSGKIRACSEFNHCPKIISACQSGAETRVVSSRERAL